jgi:hypothetical protein
VEVLQQTESGSGYEIAPLFPPAGQSSKCKNKFVGIFLHYQLANCYKGTLKG